MSVTGDRKLLPRFVGHFSIIQWVGPLTYQLHLGNHYSQVHLVFNFPFRKPFHAGGDGYLHPTAVYINDEQE